MNSKIEKLYLNCPEIIQNVLISISGLREKRLRYNGIYPQFYRSISENFKMDRQQQEQYQIDQLRRLIYTVAPKVPYYRELFSQIKLPSPDKFQLSDLEKIPILNKQVLRCQPETFLSSDANKKRLITIHTTGTTGTPLKVFCNAEVRQKNYAFFSRFLDSVGIDPAGSRATIGGRLLVKGWQSKPPFWRYSFFQKSLLLSSYHLSDSNIGSYIEILRKKKPSYIDAYPSSVYSIADYASRNRISLEGITDAIVTSAETLLGYQKELIEETFRAPVYDQYGSVEMCVFVAQCRSGQYHLHSDYSYVELLNEKGHKAAPGEEAEVICTGFINDVMPLIRYRIGDRVLTPSWEQKPCECGSGFPLIKKILGREDDVIRTPDGRKVGRLSGVLKGYPVREAQFIQFKADEIEILIVKDSQYNSYTEKSIIDEMLKRTGPSVKVIIKHVDSIERGKGGKMRHVICNIKPE
ncbi:MAG: phenylacetate--CoA ligase family protein [Fibrobacter sp.]|jgi:phenylacetate-CoA ligase|nr:phenylacetate--CoA ligase family protein [Fibrobacter sp.]